MVMTSLKSLLNVYCVTVCSYYFAKSLVSFLKEIRYSNRIPCTQAVLASQVAPSFFSTGFDELNILCPAIFVGRCADGALGLTIPGSL